MLQTARGGRSLTTAVRFDSRVLKYTPDIILTDFTICDLRGVFSSLDRHRLQAGWETLVRKALSMDGAPARLSPDASSGLAPSRPRVVAFREEAGVPARE